MPSAVTAARGLALLLAAVTASVSAAGTPFSLTLPAGLIGPTISTTLMGTTYAYSAGADANLRLMITTMPAAAVHAEFGTLSATRCSRLFLAELKRSYTDFFVAAATRPLRVGTAEFPLFRWTGGKGGETLTGALSCGMLHGYYYVVHFVDALKAATQSFPPIRSSLKHLQAAAP